MRVRTGRDRAGAGQAVEDRKDPSPDADALGGTSRGSRGEGRDAGEGGPRPAVEGGPSSAGEGGRGDVRASADDEGVLRRCLEMGTS